MLCMSATRTGPDVHSRRMQSIATQRFECKEMVAPYKRQRHQRPAHVMRYIQLRVAATATALAFVIVLAPSSLLIRPASATGIGPSLPEVLPAVKQLPEEDVAEEDERIVHLKPLSDALKTGDDNASDVLGPSSRSVDDNEDEVDEWRKSLPMKLQQRRGALRRLLVPLGGRGKDIDGDDGLCEIYLLGTSHVSKDSSEDARLLMEHVQPDVLFIELCHQRLALLADERATSDAGDEEETDADTEPGCDNETRDRHNGRRKGAEKHTREKQSRGMSWSAGMLTKMQQDYATKLGVSVGAEFREAYQAASRQQLSFEEEMNRRRFGLINPAIAHDINPVTVILGDRPVPLTILRAWESLRFFGKVKLCIGLLWSSLWPPSEKKLKEWMDKIMNDPNNDLLTDSIAELSKHFPQIGRTIIHERDEYMVCKLLQTVTLLSNVPSAGRRKRIVAVVGAGHCPGMSAMLDAAHSVFADGGSAAHLEERLQNLVETRKWKIDNQDVRSLTTDITELHFQRAP